MRNRNYSSPDLEKISSLTVLLSQLKPGPGRDPQIISLAFLKPLKKLRTDNEISMNLIFMTF